MTSLGREPPPCNTGVATTPTPRATITVALDYLGCHIEEEAEKVLPRLAEEMGAMYRMGRPAHGYAFGAEIVSGEDVWCRLWFNRKSSPYLQASGTNAQPAEDAIRRCGWGYLVQRKDAALDVFDAALWPLLVAAGKRYANEGHPPLKVEYVGDWEYAKQGRTLYLGSRKSRWYHRLYEKGRKEKTDPNWLRLEVEYKPDAEWERRQACEMTAGQVFAMRGYKPFASVLQSIGLTPEQVFDWPVHQQLRVRRDVERARRALAAQYGKTVQTWLQDCGGDPQAFVAELLVAVEHQRQVREWSHAPTIDLEELRR